MLLQLGESTKSTKFVVVVTSLFKLVISSFPIMYEHGCWFIITTLFNNTVQAGQLNHVQACQQEKTSCDESWKELPGSSNHSATEALKNTGRLQLSIVPFHYQKPIFWGFELDDSPITVQPSMYIIVRVL